MSPLQQPSLVPKSGVSTHKPYFVRMSTCEKSGTWVYHRQWLPLVVHDRYRWIPPRPNKRYVCTVSTDPTTWIRRGAVLIVVAGAACLIGSIYGLTLGKETAPVALAALGLGAMVVAAFAPKLTGTLRLGPSGIELTFVNLVGIVATPDSAQFVKAVEGHWWEIIDSPDARSAVSLFRVFVDKPSSSLMLRGAGYRKDGSESANWESQMIRFVPSEFKLMYLWTGHWVGQDEDRGFHGLGTLEFDPPDESSPRCTRAKGQFWHVDEATPANTRANKIRLRRDDRGSETVMSDGTTQERAGRIAWVLNKWPRHPE